MFQSQVKTRQLSVADLSQSNNDGILLEIVPFSRGNFNGEHPQNRLNIRRVNGYLALGSLFSSL